MVQSGQTPDVKMSKRKERSDIGKALKMLFR